jgi:signal transduction histidine kinase
VHIEGVAGDGTAFDLEGPIHFPAGTRRTTFRYVGLSLSNSERVRYRYRLDGLDRGWSEGGTNREATYNNLSAGTYRFRVMASNSEGLWNGSEATVGFEVEPTLWQTWWFQLGCVVCAGLTTFLMYRLRMRQLTQLLKVGFEERLAERARIARELHDTLLQSFQGLMMKLYALTFILDRPTEARVMLEGLLEEGRQAIAEGRDAVRGMRSSTVIQNDLARGLAVLGERLAAEQNARSPVNFRVLVEGKARDLHPILRDEVYRIASEATCNAFRHSGAGRIEIEICYDKNQLRVRVQDNGKGIDAKVLHGGGREGHYGLPGMKERAKLAGGKLTVWSKLDSGTEVQLTIPASLAYGKSSAPSQSIS